jgi:hypothetical protein
MSLYFPQVPATFVHVPRTGGTSFEKWVEQNIDGYERYARPEHVDINHPMSTLADLQKLWPTTGTVFSFVRNPYARLVSMYHRIGQRAEHAVKQYSDSLVNRTELNNWRVHPYQSQSLVSALLDETEIVKIYRKGFSSWVESVYTQSDEMYQLRRPRALLTIKWWTDTRNHVDHYCGKVPDVIVRLENVSAEFSQVQELLGCNVPLLHENKSEHDDYRSYYTPESRRMVGELFKRDLDTFNYDF